MPFQGEGTDSALKARKVPLLVLAGSLALSVLVAWQAGSTVEARERLRFRNLVQRTQDTIRNRLELYTGLLRGGAAHFAASDSVGRGDFHTYVERLELSSRYPGILGFGYTTLVRPGEAGRLVARMRREGFPGFRIWPERSGERHSILYLEPLNRRNRAAIGYDMSSEPTRRAAMLRARDLGRAAASGKVTLVQEIDREKQAGFLIYVPVYRGGQVPETVPERRAALTGYVYSPFRADDLFQGIFGSEREPRIAFRIYDGTTTAESELLHASPAGRPGYRPRFETTETMEIAGRPWSVRYTTRPEFDASTLSHTSVTLVTGFLGVLLSALLASLTWVLAAGRERAERSAEALRRSEATLRLHGRVLDSMAEGVSVTDEQGIIVYTNPTEDRMFGYEPGELTGKHVTIQNDYPPEENERIVAGVIRELRSQGAWSGEWRNRKKDGTPFTTFTHISLLETGGKRYFVYVQSDITERIAVEEALRSASRHKDEFLTMLAHELRNPLGAISNALHLLQNAKPDSPARARAKEVIARQVAHQARMVNDLLDVSRIGRGKMELTPERLDLLRVVRDAVTDHEGAEAGPRITLAAPPEEPIWVMGDPTRLTQVLSNLLDNARKFTPEDGEVRVEVEVDERNRQVTVAVADTGSGIDPQLLRHIFEPFTQAEQSLDRRRGGLGLGLALVKGLVEMHGGQVAAASDGPGKGARFTFTLPLAAPAPPAKADGSGPHRPSRRVRVLVVEDNADAADTLREILEMKGYPVRVASTGPAGIETATQFRPEVVLCDIGLPGMDGYEVAARLRQTPETASARLIAVTGYGSERDRRRSEAAGFERHLTKPIDLAELERALLDGASDGAAPA